MRNNIWSKLTVERLAAITAGAGLIIMALAAAFSYGYAHSALVIPGNADATLHNLILQKGLFRAEISGWVLILLCDIAVALACYRFLKPVHTNLSLLGAGLRLVYTAVLGLAILHLADVLRLVSAPGAADGAAAHQLADEAMTSLLAFESVWSTGLIVFGTHLLALGLLALKARGIPNWVGILLLVAAAGYVVTHTLTLFGPRYEELRTTLDMILTAPMAAGELAFALWLLFSGGKKPVHPPAS